MKYSMNFLWIQAQPDIPQENPIPDGLMDNVHAFANMNPDVCVNLWVDFFGVGRNTPFALSAMNSPLRAENIKLQSLDTIDGYTSNPLFRRPFTSWDESQTFWDRIDLAKIYILRHLLKNEEENAIFSDMDIDFSIKFEYALDVLRQHGAVVGLDPYNGIENQFFGFSAHKRDFVENVLARKPQPDEEHNGEYHKFCFSFDPEFIEPYRMCRFDITTQIDQILDYKTIKYAYQKDPEKEPDRHLAIEL